MDSAKFWWKKFDYEEIQIFDYQEIGRIVNEIF